MSYDSYRNRLLCVRETKIPDLWIAQFEPPAPVETIKKMVEQMSKAQKRNTTLGRHNLLAIENLYHAVGRENSFQDGEELKSFYRGLACLRQYVHVDYEELSEKSILDMSEAELKVMGIDTSVKISEEHFVEFSTD